MIWLKESNSTTSLALYINYWRSLVNKLFNVSSLIISALLFGNIQIAFASSLVCDKYIGCERKFCEIESQITIAKNNANDNKVKGLNIALKESKSSCSTKSLMGDLISEIAEVKEEILDYKNDLNEAVAVDKPNKIIKFNEKIVEEKTKLKQLEAELKTLQ